MTISNGLVGAKRFLDWWFGELLALVPQDLRSLPRPTDQFVWVEFGAEQVTMRQIIDGRLEERGRIDLISQDMSARKLAFKALLGGIRNPRVGVNLPAEQVLRKQVRLPPAATENLRQVLGFELNRYTPFHADQVYFDYRLAGRDTQSGMALVDLTIMVRRSVDDGLAQLREWGVQVQAVVPTDELIGVARYTNLLPVHLRPSVPSSEKLRYMALAALSALLLFIALAFPLWQKRDVAIALDNKAVTEKQQAESVQKLRQELDESRSEYQYLVAKKVEYPAKVVLLEEISRLLPDDTWLSRMEIRGEKLVISGVTGSSTSLIRTLEKSPMLQNAAFSSPVVKQRNNTERFQIGADIKKTDPNEALKAQEEAATQKTAGRKRTSAGAVGKPVPNAGAGRP